MVDPSIDMQVQNGNYKMMLPLRDGVHAFALGKYKTFKGFVSDVLEEDNSIQNIAFYDESGER